MKNDQLTELKTTLDSLQQTMWIPKEGPGVLAAAMTLGLDEDEVVNSLSGRAVRVLWSVKPTGVPHLGLYLPIRDLALLSKHPGFIVGVWCVIVFYLFPMICQFKLVHLTDYHRY